MKILEKNKSHIIYKEDNGIVSIVPNTPYFHMKVVEWKNERIKLVLIRNSIDFLVKVWYIIMNKEKYYVK